MSSILRFLFYMFSLRPWSFLLLSKVASSETVVLFNTFSSCNPLTFHSLKNWIGVISPIRFVLLLPFPLG